MDNNVTRETNLRQANTRATAVGYLSDKKLEYKTEKGETRIEGTVTIKTSDTNYVQFAVYCKEKTQKNEPNRAYAGLETVMNEFKSIADVGIDEADIIRANGQLNLFHGQNGQDYIGYRANFFTRIKQIDKVEPEASFEAECFIKSMIPEVDSDGEDTGRMKITGWVPTYNGIEPIEMFVPADLVDAADANYEPGQTVEFYGDIVNNRITTTIEKPVAFGKPKKEVKTSYVNELIITGGSEPYDGDEETDKDHVPYKAEVIQAAVKEREQAIEEAKNKPKAGTGSKGTAQPSGKKHGRTLGF